MTYPRFIPCAEGTNHQVWSWNDEKQVYESMFKGVPSQFVHIIVDALNSYSSVDDEKLNEIVGESE